METNKSNNRQPLSKCEPPAGNIAEVEAAWLAALANTYFDEFIKYGILTANLENKTVSYTEKGQQMIAELETVGGPKADTISMSVILGKYFGLLKVTEGEITGFNLTEEGESYVESLMSSKDIETFSNDI